MINEKQEKINQFDINVVFHLVLRHKNQYVISTKWIYRNKLDENGIVTKNKVRLVAQWYKQEEIINFDETFAPIAN